MSYRRPSYERWSPSEVCCWLRTSGFADITDLFNAKGVQGCDLVRVDDAFLQSRIGIGNPQIRAKLLEAIDTLIGRAGTKRTPPKATDSSAPAPPPMRRGVTMPSGVGTASGKPPSVDEVHPAQLQANPRRSLTQTTLLPAGGASTPVEKISAQELLHSGATFSGWIRKQGGSVRTCK